MNKETRSQCRARITLVIVIARLRVPHALHYRALEAMVTWRDTPMYCTSGHARIAEQWLQNHLRVLRLANDGVK